MAVKLKTPLGEEVLELRAGDVVYLSGRIYTARDAAHRKILELSKKGKLPFELEGAVIYHCGPVVRRKEDGWKVVSAGPTTSARMNRYLDEILSLGVRGIIGKGGMEVGPFVGRAVYFAFTGGAGSLAAESVKRVVDVYWLDELGIPEAVWVLEVEDFPLLVAIDSRGNSLYR
ncbi:probable fumarate hydratase, beta subunit [Thermococcus kodakarensis KOD1]|uniref:Probable fumarate hydratase, beta subunit n=1 Tax=Thermococcus kodakarensis (strain ATCC BAA-918 / JCM 12380 / KOD1) TaxID=69014 RepID=Q5JGC6_THEKO|nr:FumA C-terminus/TtdB family hydratase beta subunit [Thermococcus kodakarensis]WCN27847.1 FumA C-terminus/TtdB family hydratase beta subunit [Thermococcus kodakarensis]WCN30145.1 FumA C-terminus/TtdB family hydratase beta subunit [Thermococcus kodakarensis]BAD86153.1 probable fumarate hydratase, beta subunit [Thermococcus kodakarensis KOD1]